MEITYFDLETQHLFEELGMTDENAAPSKLKMALGGTLRNSVFDFYEESEVKKLIEQLKNAELIVGFNVLNFDYAVLSAYDPDVRKMLSSKTFDMWQNLKDITGCMISLESLCMLNLGVEPKPICGKDIPRLWREGKKEDVRTHLIGDLGWTEELYLHGKREKRLVYDHKEYDRTQGKRVSLGHRVVKVDW